MPRIVIQIAKLEAPTVDQAGRKFGAKAYDTAGTKYTVQRAMFGMLQNGGWYEIFYEDKTFQGNPYKEIQSVKATAPVGETATASVPTAAVPIRARTAEADEQQINKRHRLTWIGERLDAVAGQLPLDYERLRPVAEIFANIYDNLGDGNEFDAPAQPKSAAPSNPDFNSGAAGSGQRFSQELSDEIPFAPEFR